MTAWRSLKVFALGHSTREQEELIALLQAHGVLTLADIRTVPKSRTNPQFNKAELTRVLPRYGIRYLHIPDLGGLRRSIGEESLNRAWRNAGFRGYADHMQTEEFDHGLAILKEQAELGPVAVMCAEALRWRCHRSLLADALFARGCVVQHIESMTKSVAHQVTPFAQVLRGRVTYPHIEPGSSLIHERAGRSVEPLRRKL
jgi:uncharacterized protein (DUF488 family)